MLTESLKGIIIIAEDSMNWDERIDVKPGVMMGKPIIKGTRITVELILERLQAGETVEQISNSLKSIDSEDVHAAIEYAIESVRREKVYITPETH
jgi:uncharacterized protein (DUF433 family)